MFKATSSTLLHYTYHMYNLTMSTLHMCNQTMWYTRYIPTSTKGLLFHFIITIISSVLTVVQYSKGDFPSYMYICTHVTMLISTNHNTAIAVIALSYWFSSNVCTWYTSSQSSSLYCVRVIFTLWWARTLILYIVSISKSHVWKIQCRHYTRFD